MVTYWLLCVLEAATSGRASMLGCGAPSSATKTRMPGPGDGRKIAEGDDGGWKDVDTRLPRNKGARHNEWDRGDRPRAYLTNRKKWNTVVFKPPWRT